MIDYDDRCDPNIMVGQKIDSFDPSPQDDVLATIICGNNRFVFFHTQSCCESVTLEHWNMREVVGKVVDSVRAWTDNDLPEEFESGTLESWTNTNVEIRSGSSIGTMRFLGTSNGYYSENVDFAMLT